jgi:hypothetical protein
MRKMSNLSLVRQNLRLVKKLYPAVTVHESRKLRELTREFGLSLSLGEISNLDGNWYVTHSGLLRLARRRHCAGIRSGLQDELSNPIANRWVFRAVVYPKVASRGFVGYGDADPSNVSPLVRGAEMRVAETRAVNRALRKAYGIGLCSVDELGWLGGSSKASPAPPRSNGFHSPNKSNAGQPRLRDQLCLLIREHNLDPGLVKAYAADFCGTAELRDASRDLVKSFISRLADEAKQDAEALHCKLNSYAQPAEVNS